MKLFRVDLCPEVLPACVAGSEEDDNSGDEDYGVARRRTARPQHRAAASVSSTSHQTSDTLAVEITIYVVKICSAKVPASCSGC